MPCATAGRNYGARQEAPRRPRADRESGRCPQMDMMDSGPFDTIVLGLHGWHEGRRGNGEKFAAPNGKPVWSRQLTGFMT